MHSDVYNKLKSSTTNKHVTRRKKYIIFGWHIIKYLKNAESATCITLHIVPTTEEIYSQIF